jgi:hypothetical protein
VEHFSVNDNGIEPIVVYMIDRHPLEQVSEPDPFRWLHPENGFVHELKGFVGPFRTEELSLLVDDAPAGPAWKQLINALVAGKIRMVVTHLAPLTSGQRQQLIGVCAFTGARLVTPGDGGRNSYLMLAKM